MGKISTAMLSVAMVVLPAAAVMSGLGTDADPAAGEAPPTTATGITRAPAAGGDSPRTANGPGLPSTTASSESSEAASPDFTASRPAMPADLTESCEAIRTWDYAPGEEAGHSGNALFRVRAGEHECFDRVVFDIDGADTPGALVRYVPVVRADGSGTAYPVAGAAALEVTVRSSITGYPDGPATMGTAGDSPYPADELSGWRTLRQVRFAGFFEGQATVALGVREHLPFRAFTLTDAEEGISKLVVDIAHDT